MVVEQYFILSAAALKRSTCVPRSTKVLLLQENGLNKQSNYLEMTSLDLICVHESAKAYSMASLSPGYIVKINNQGMHIHVSS